MRVDRRRYVRDLALAAPLFGARGLNSAAYAQGLNALADVKNPKFVLDPSSPEPLPTRDGRRRLAAAHLWCGSKSIITASINNPLMGGINGEEDTVSTRA